MFFPIFISWVKKKAPALIEWLLFAGTRPIETIRLHAQHKLFYSIKSPFCDYEMLFLCHCSLDIDKISLFPNFQSIRRLRLKVMHVLLCCTGCIGHNVVYFSCRHSKKANSAIISSKKWICKKYSAHIHYVPKGFWRCKNLNFFGGKWWMRLLITKWTFNLWKIQEWYESRYHWENKRCLHLNKNNIC